MVWEAAAAAIVGLLIVWIILRPILLPRSVRPPAFEPVDPLETPRGVALAALKEVEFDRAIGKLSEADYEELKARYTAEALAALRAEAGGAGVPPAGAAADAPASASAPDDAEVEALIAVRVAARGDSRGDARGGGMVLACRGCGPRPEPDAVFCSTCGRRLEPACAQCGSVLPAGGRFCERCGTQVAA